MLSGLAAWATGVIEKGSYVGLSVLVTLENVFPPIPSEVILPLAGFLTGQGKLSFAGAVFAATFGSVSGALILYYLGYCLGEDRVRYAVASKGKWLLVSTQDYDKSARWFARHGNKAVFAGRFVPGIRSFISLPAGIQKMPLFRFTLYTALGSAIWNVILIGFGWWMGARWTEVGEHIQKFEAALWICFGLVVLWWVVHKARLCRRQAC